MCRLIGGLPPWFFEESLAHLLLRNNSNVVKEQEHDVSRHPYTEVNARIAQTCEDVFAPQWVDTHLIDPAHDLVILRHIIPWQPIIDYLVPFYDNQKGRMG